jgi:hypothetical protein
MGLAVLSLDVGDVARPEEMRRVEFLIDSGAIYSVVPAATLEAMGIKPISTQDFSSLTAEKSRGEKVSRFSVIRIASAEQTSSSVSLTTAIFLAPSRSRLLVSRSIPYDESFIRCR